MRKPSDQNTSFTRMLSLLLAGGLVAGMSKAGDAAGANPYQAIVERNPFGIRPMSLPLPPPPPITNAPPRIDLKLTGISTIFGPPIAYLMFQKPGAKAPEYLNLKAGERTEDVQMVSIDAARETVTVRTQGREVVLNFLENGAVTKALPPPPPRMPKQGTPQTAAITRAAAEALAKANLEQAKLDDQLLQLQNERGALRIPAGSGSETAIISFAPVTPQNLKSPTPPGYKP